MKTKEKIYRMIIIVICKLFSYNFCISYYYCLNMQAGVFYRILDNTKKSSCKREL